MKKLLILSCIISLTSCATIINGKKETINVYTKKQATVKFDGEEFKSNKKGTEHKLKIRTSKENVFVVVESDSTTRKLKLEPRTSKAFLLNTVNLIVLPVGVGGFILDIHLENNFTYQKYNYIDLSKTDPTGNYNSDMSFEFNRKNNIEASYDFFAQSLNLSYERFIKTNKKSLQINVGLINSSILNMNYAYKKDGISIGLEPKYYYNHKIRSRKYVSFDLEYQYYDQQNTRALINKNKDIYSHTFDINKNTLSTVSKIGHQSIIGKRMTVDFAVGLGVKFVKTKHYNSIPNGFNVKPRGFGSGPSLGIGKAIDEKEIEALNEGNNIQLDGYLNVKIGYLF